MVSLYSSGVAGGSGGSGSDLALASLSKSSKSASINSSSMGEVKRPNFTLEAFEAIPDDISNQKEAFKGELPGTSPTLEASVGSSEPLISLKLGKGTYFEDISAGSNAKNLSYSSTPGPSPTLAKRSNPNCQGLRALMFCVAKLRAVPLTSLQLRITIGNTDLWKSLYVVWYAGSASSVANFDEKKRSCRRCLSDHNARCHKPHTEAFHFNAARLSSSSSSNDRKQHMSFVWNKVPVLHKARPNETFTWEGTCDSKPF